MDIDELLRHGGAGWEAVADELLKQYPSVKYPGSVMGSPGALATYALAALRRIAIQDESVR